MNILISACLLGVSCRYDGRSKPFGKELLDQLKEKHHLIPICPEIFGGLSTPRIPSEITSGRRVLRKDGKDTTEEYQKGAEEALRLADFFDCKLAVLKARSPSCGRDRIYDGTFSGTLTSGNGIAAEVLMQNGIRVIAEEELADFLKEN